MAGPTIDHMVSVIILVAALLLSFTVYNQTLANAIAYERHRQLAMKAMDLMDTICLSSGDPPHWGQSHSTPSAFGLQDPESAGYTLSPFSLQRLLHTGNPVLYNGTWYSNVSLGEGNYLLMPVTNCVNYTTVARLLGVNGSYGFQLSITPTLTVSITENRTKPLRLEVLVRGPGLALSGATLHYYLYRVYKPDYSDYPLIESRSNITETDSTGSALLEFPSIDGSENTYSLIVYAHLGGLNGVGYYSHDVLEDYPPFIVPFIESFENGTIILAHSWDVHYFGTPVPSVFYNATFLVLTENFDLRPVQIATGHLVYGTAKAYNTTQVPVSESGILFISYWAGGPRFGTVMVPWGVSTLGVSVTFGDEPSDREWVATELRQVTFNDMSYQVKLAVWSLED